MAIKKESRSEGILRAENSAKKGDYRVAAMKYEELGNEDYENYNAPGVRDKIEGHNPFDEIADEYSRASKLYLKSYGNLRLGETPFDLGPLIKWLELKIKARRVRKEGNPRLPGRDLTSNLSSVIAIAGVLGGIFFLSSNITGNAIANLSTKTTSFLGTGLLVVSLIVGFFWINSKKR